MKQILFVFLLLIIVSCSHNNTTSPNNSIEIINLNTILNVKEWDISKYEYSGHVIKLETNDDCLLYKISKIFFSKNRIYVKTATPQIFIFDFEGKYINKIKLGLGPDEIANMKDACFDKEKNELIIYQEPELKFYTPDGFFLKQQNSPYYFKVIYSIDDGYILRSSVGYMNCKESPNASMLYVDKDWNFISAFLPVSKSVIYTNKGVSYNNTNDDILILPDNHKDTIYFFDKNTLTPKYYLDYSTQKLNVSEMKRVGQYYKELGKKFEFTNFLENSTHEFFQIGNPSPISIFRDKESKIMKAGKFERVEETPFIARPMAVYDDYFVCVQEFIDLDFKYTKSHVFSPEDLAKINNQKEDDNPLLIFFKLKPFEDEK